MFVDTSAIISILSEEEDADEFSRRIIASETRLTSALVILEAVMRLSTKLKLPPLEVANDVESLCDRLSLEVVPINEQDGAIAVEAFARFGKGRGHPAQLNLADCLSYACAKSRGVPLLYKGNDFSRTDLK
jgi:ribonuclease VapC